MTDLPARPLVPKGRALVMLVVLQTEVGRELACESVQFGRGEQSSTSEQAASGHGLKGGHVGVRLPVPGKPGIRRERHVDLFRTGCSRHGDHRNVTEPRIQRIVLNTTAGCIPKSSKSTSHT